MEMLKDPPLQHNTHKERQRHHSGSSKKEAAAKQQQVLGGLGQAARSLCHLLEPGRPIGTRPYARGPETDRTLIAAAAERTQ